LGIKESKQRRNCYIVRINHKVKLINQRNQLKKIMKSRSRKLWKSLIKHWLRIVEERKRIWIVFMESLLLDIVNIIMMRNRESLLWDKIVNLFKKKYLLLKLINLQLNNQIIKITYRCNLHNMIHHKKCKQNIVQLINSNSKINNLHYKSILHQ
jgi:hypothetical protein